MKIETNRVNAIINYYRIALASYYEKEEIENFIFLSFEAFLGYKRTDLVLKKNALLTESLLLKFMYVVKALKKHKPIQYVLGHTVFYGLTLSVNEHVLIPRQETEELVDGIIKENKNKYEETQVKHTDFSILDIGTGSGCIAIALKKNFPKAKVYALDISAAALQMAKENALLNHTEINFIPADILNYSIDLFPLDFDIIVSNPPYVRLSEKKNMNTNVLEYEPHLALFVNDDKPLQFYEVIADIATKKLKPEGNLYVEINEALGIQTVNLFKNKGFQKIQLKKDLNGKERIIIVDSIIY